MKEIDAIARYLRWRTEGGKDDDEFAISLISDCAPGLNQNVPKWIREYIRLVDAKVITNMGKCDPYKSAKKDLDDEIKDLRDHCMLIEGVTPATVDSNDVSFVKKVKDLFHTFVAQALQKAIQRISADGDAENGGSPALKCDILEDELVDTLSEFDQIVKTIDITDEVVDGELGVDPSESEFVREALLSDFLSEEESKLKFLLSLEIVVGAWAQTGIAQEDVFSFTIAGAMKVYDAVSNSKNALKMLQVRSFLKALENSAEGESLFGVGERGGNE